MKNYLFLWICRRHIKIIFFFFLHHSSEAASLSLCGISNLDPDWICNQEGKNWPQKEKKTEICMLLKQNLMFSPVGWSPSSRVWIGLLQKTWIWNNVSKSERLMSAYVTLAILWGWEWISRPIIVVCFCKDNSIAGKNFYSYLRWLKSSFSIPH